MEWIDNGKYLKGRHKYTNDNRVQYRCLESVYIITLLEYGFGFHGTHRNITLALEVCRHINLLILLLIIAQIG
jgi:hypothetical protein